MAYIYDYLCLQIILEDLPAVLGPNYETEAVCLECLSRVDGSYLCTLVMYEYKLLTK